MGASLLEESLSRDSRYKTSEDLKGGHADDLLLISGRTLEDKALPFES